MGERGRGRGGGWKQQGLPPFTGQLKNRVQADIMLEHIQIQGSLYDKCLMYKPLPPSLSANTHTHTHTIGLGGETESKTTILDFMGRCERF